jgi:ribosomal protein S18 acetylase RimI-like enzyme
MSCYIRYATAKDADLLGHIYPIAYCSAYRGLIPDSVLNKINSRYMKKLFYEIITKKLEKVALIYENNKVAGFMSIGKYSGKDLDNTWGEIKRIHLLPSFRGRGIGTEFLTWGLNELSSMGYKKVCLWVFEKNTRARHFYEKFGFTHDGKIKVLFLDKPLNLYRYAKLL